MKNEKMIHDEIYRLSSGKGSGIVVTVVKKTGSGPAETGTKMLVYPDGSTLGTVGGGTIEKMAVERALALFNDKKNHLEEFVMQEDGEGTQTGMMCGGTATLFFEYYAPHHHVYIFGAGHVGSALVYHLKTLDYFITVLDDREDMLNALQGADEKIHGSFETVLSDRAVERDSYFIIATYEHRADSLVLNRIFKEGWKPRYVGMVASRHKQKIMLKELKKAVPEANTDVCYIPVGLDTGGGLPHDIAISIVAEVQKIRYQSRGGHLRDQG
ncbi:MAG: XdhC family protein [Fidelibacterota bacterium]